MADSTLAALSAAAALAGTTVLLYGTQDGGDVKISKEDIKTFVSASPTLVTPTLGVAIATSINKVALTAPATAATLTIADGKTLTASKSLTLDGTDGTTMTFPGVSASIPGLAVANVFTTLQTITIGAANTGVLASTGYSLTGSNATGMINLAGTWNTTGAPTAIKLNITDTASDAASLLFDLQIGGSSKFKIGKDGFVTFNDGNSTIDQYGSLSSNQITLASLIRISPFTAPTAGGSTAYGVQIGSGPIGIYIGSGAPTISAAKGSLYLRSDGSTTNDRAYINTNGSTTWTALTTAA